MQKKFQPKDKVFYVIDEYPEDHTECIHVSYVVTIEEARKYYSREGKLKPTVESITEKCLHEHGCYPVFSEDEFGSGIIGWMPENELHPCTKVAKILFQK